jgi:hypothetical protein
MLQFKEPNLAQKLDDRLKNLTSITEYTSFKRCLDMAEKTKVGRCPVKTAWRTKNTNEGIFINNLRWRIRRYYPTVVQMETHSMCMDFRSIRTDFG